MSEVVEINEPGDKVWTISDEGQVHVWQVQDDGSFREVNH